MIDEIQVNNLALIKSASFVPDARLTVLTGETGAGKTALLSALKLLMGARADKTSVRQDSSALKVCGRFYDLKPGLDDEQEVVVERQVSDDGRSRVYIDGGMASVRQLSDLIEGNIDLCGQHEQQKLFKASNHQAIFDNWAGAEVLNRRAQYVDCLLAYRTAKQKLANIMESLNSNTEKLERAHFELEQIDEVNPDIDEYNQLIDDLKRAENAEELAESVAKSCVLLDGSDGMTSMQAGIIDSLVEAADSLERASRIDESLVEHVKILRESGYLLQDVAAEIKSYVTDIDISADELEKMREKVLKYQHLMREFGPTVKDVVAYREQLTKYVEMFDDKELCISEAKLVLQRAKENLIDAAEGLQAARKAVSVQFESSVNEQMALLDMGKSQIVVAFEPLDFDKWTEAGPVALEFCFVPAEGLKPMPLSKIASGGEMSRVLLACKVVSGTTDDVKTLVFDEVDAGVGGRTAVALAQVLRELSRTHQVIVVTHLPQIAACSDVHYVVEKQEKDCKIPETEIKRVEGADRVREVARMLSGEITEVSLKHAEELLAGSGANE